MIQKMEDESFCAPEIDYPTHWNKVYINTAAEKLGWYENNPEKTLELIEKCNLDNNATIFIPGAGATTLVDELVTRKFTHLIANDISEAALIKLKERIGRTETVKFIIDDLTRPKKLQYIEHIHLWVDRAVLHFFLSEKDQQAYFNLLKRLVASKGYVIIAQFNMEGAKKCSGLDIVNYDEQMIQERLGGDFKLVDSFNYTYINPSGGKRPYVYTLFQRK